jgi:hypothetical protein
MLKMRKIIGNVSCKRRWDKGLLGVIGEKIRVGGKCE